VPQVVKLMRKEHLPVASLCRTAREVVAGKLGAGEADLNGGLFKKRVARPGGGKSGGYRMILAYRRPGNDRVLFAYAFAKNAAATLTPQGHEALVKAAGRFLAADNRQIAALLAFGDVNEMVCDGE
jgi:hypothetical protein